MAAKKQIFVCLAKTVVWPNFEGKKNTFPKEFFNKIWLKVGEHEYTYLHLWNKLWKKLFCLKMVVKTSLSHCTIMLIFAN